MREIKFRGQTANGKWAYGSLVHSENIQPAIYFEVGKGTVKTFDFVYVKPETIGQFTGLHDKHGIEIYEGDILGFAIRHASKGTVVYYYSGFSLVWDEDTARVKKEIQMEWIPDNVSIMWEVIGNIHDNKELLQ